MAQPDWLLSWPPCSGPSRPPARKKQSASPVKNKTTKRRSRQLERWVWLGTGGQAWREQRRQKMDSLPALCCAVTWASLSLPPAAWKAPSEVLTAMEVERSDEETAASQKNDILSSRRKHLSNSSVVHNRKLCTQLGTHHRSKLRLLAFRYLRQLAFTVLLYISQYVLSKTMWLQFNCRNFYRNVYKFFIYI